MVFKRYFRLDRNLLIVKTREKLEDMGQKELTDRIVDSIKELILANNFILEGDFTSI